MENENINMPVTENTAAPVEAPVPTPEQPLATETVMPEVQSQPTNLPNPPSEGGQVKIFNLLQKAKEKIQFRKRAKLEKIMAQAQSKGKITNDNVQKLLRCSDATATRYLSQLVKEGRLTRAGVGPASFYEFLK